MISLPMVSRMSRGGMRVIVSRCGSPACRWPSSTAGGRAVDDDAAVLEDLHEVLEALVAALDGLQRTEAHMPRISESMGTFSEVAAPSGG